MTLVILERLNNKIRIVTDSRLSFSTFGNADVCVKLFEIPINVATGPLENEEIVYERKWCLATAGSIISSYLLKEIAFQTLNKIRLTKNPEDFCLDLCEFVLKLHKLIWD